MKRNLLLNRIVSLSMIAVLYLSMSASALADAEDTGDTSEPTVSEEATESVSEPSATETEPAAAAGGSDATVQAEGEGTTDTTVTSDTVQPVENTTASNEDIIANPSDDNQAPVENPTEVPSENPTEVPSENPAEVPTEVPTEEAAVVDELTGEIINPLDEVLTEKETEEEESDEKELRYKELSEKKANGEELTPEELEELEKLEKELLVKTEAAAVCEHELTYTSNDDGTHTVKCSKCDGFEEFTESCEFDEDGICIKCGYKRPKDPILIYEDDEVIVTVSGAIPENADLKVKPIKADNDDTRDAYQQIEDKLNEETKMNEADEYGFLAYDISFVDIDTNEEVEPDGDVTVTMEYKNAVLPDSIGEDEDAETEVEMIHFKEDYDDLENLSEQGKADLSLDSSSAITQAEFTSDTFSTYVIKWTSNKQTRYIKIVTAFYTQTDEELVEFTVEDEEIAYSTNSGNNVHPNDIILKDRFGTRDIDGYRYLKALYRDDNGVDHEVDKLIFSQTNSGNTSGYNKYMHILNGNDEIAKIKMQEKQENMTHVLISFIYERDADLSITKKATGDAGADDETQYEFVLTNESGTPMSNVKYFIGRTPYHTDGSGKFLLKTGESAYFGDDASLDGNYKISETGVAEGGAYTLDQFRTEVIVNGEVKETVAQGTDDLRGVQVSVTPGELTDVLYRNYLTAHTTGDAQPEKRYKYIKYIEDQDYYQLGLKYTPPYYEESDIIFNGEYNSTMEPTKVDIVLIIDKSGSMKDNNRMAHTKEAVKTLADIFKTKKGVDSRWKIVTFGGTASLKTANWITCDKLNIDDVAADGATNYEAALRLANTQLGTARSDAKKIVLFLTDGEPTAYGNDEGTRYAFDIDAYDLAMGVAETISCDAFYAIGVDFGSSKFMVHGDNLTAKQILERIAGNVNTSDATVVEVKSSQIVELFRDFAGKVMTTATSDFTKITTEHKASNVVITDTLSEYVTIRPDSDFYIGLTIDGEDVWQTSVCEEGHIDEAGVMTKAATFDVVDGGNTYQLTATYEDGVMTLDFPDDYELNPTYDFYVVIEIIPSDYAYETYLESGYNAVGDDETDNKTVPLEKWTSSGCEGFRSNSHAEVTRTYDGEREPIPFPHPVVQVHFKNVWEIYKVNGDGVKLNEAEFRLQETGDIDTAKVYTGETALSGSSDGLLVWNLEANESIATDKVYKLTETKAPSGYAKSGDYWIITVSSENVPTVERFSEEGISQGVYEVTPTREGKVFIYRFEFLNLAMYSLPNTGGNGIYKTTLLGIAMMLTSSYLFYRNKRKQRGFAR